MRAIRIVVLVAAFVTPAFGVARAEDASTSAEAALIQAATTPEQHAALAVYYRERAERARRQAASHQVMSHSYTGMKPPLKEAGARHCAKLAETYALQAAQYEELAAAEDAAAKVE